MDSQKTNAYGIKVFHQFNGFEFQGFTSATNTDIVLSYDADWGNSDSHMPYIYDYFSETLRNRETFGQELRLVSDSADFSSQNMTEWVVGLSFLDIKEENLKKDDGIYGDPSDPYGPYVSQSSSSSKFSSDNISIYANIDYLLNASTKISFGARWEDYESKYSDSFDENFSPSDRMSGGKISVSKNLNEQTNIFFNLAKGFNQGGFNLNLGLDPNSQNNNLYYDPEFLTNYEIGFNSEISNSKITISGIIFHSNREDQQVLISTQVDPSDPNTFTFLTQNAAEGINRGLELNMTMQVSNSLDVFFNLGLLKTEIKNWESRPDLEGRAQAHAPEKSYALGLKWNPFENSFLSINIVGKSDFYYSDSHNNKSKSYALTNINYSYISGQWTYSIWGRNIFDKYYSTRGFYFGNEAPNFTDTLYERHGDPRHIGVTVKYDF
jgi:outer membrane receptor for monomeric catechols